ncbi:MAG: SDR family oxidoreductase [Pseudomonadota bacterium]|nr:SDR family oxidoreductase [Pseudomonadota bacterium]
MTQQGLLNKKNGLVTGGSSGLGLAIAKALTDEGSRVAITGRNSDSLRKAVEQIGPETLGLEADVRLLGHIETLFQKVFETFGPLDVLVANAGISISSSIDTTTEDLFDDIVSTNLKGVYFTVQKSLPYLNNGASIILLSSALGQLGVPGMSVYSATKAGIRSFARSFSAELIAKGIRVNALSPGPIDTPIFSKMGLSKEEISSHVERDVPLGRMGNPDEVGRAAVFLACDASSYMIGSELVMDGGHSQI